MIRIITATAPKAINITVDGVLSGECVEALGACVREAAVDGKPVRLFLRDVSSIDETGRALLDRLATSGVHLSASGIYSSYVVSEINRAARRARTHNCQGAASA
jgi:hypothetical protein